MAGKKVQRGCMDQVPSVTLDRGVHTERTQPLKQREEDEGQASASTRDPPSMPSATMRWKSAALVCTSAMQTLAISLWMWGKGVL